MNDLMQFIGWLFSATTLGIAAFTLVLLALDGRDNDLLLTGRIATIVGLIVFVFVMTASPYPEVWFNE